MRVLVFGASGMLGRELMLRLGRAGHVTRGPSRAMCDISNTEQIFQQVDEFQPEVVINAAGVFDADGKWPVPRASIFVAVNSLGPHLLAEACRALGARLVHISTDCIFSGTASSRRAYGPQDMPGPRDLYGRSKLAGEPEDDHVAVIRTSFIGPQHGLWRWFASQQYRAAVGGWQNARWSGSTAAAVAEVIVERIVPDPEQSGKLHLATERAISKYDLLLLLRDLLDRDDIIVNGVGTPFINRALRPSPGLVLPPVAEALSRYKQESA